MKIGLLGGAFNPPHFGHVITAQQALDFAGFDQVWLLPTLGAHHMRPDVISIDHRLNMLSLIETEKIRISTLEIDNKLDGKTIHLLPFLPKEHEFTFIIGADWLPTFHKWDHFEILLTHLTFLVMPRYGYDNAPLYKNMRVLDHPLLMTTDASATKVRERIRMGLSLDGFVPKPIIEYISIHHLYQ